MRGTSGNGCLGFPVASLDGVAEGDASDPHDFIPYRANLCPPPTPATALPYIQLSTGYSLLPSIFKGSIKSNLLRNWTRLCRDAAIGKTRKTVVLPRFEGCRQSHYREVARWEIFIRNWDLGWIWASLVNFEAVFSCFHGQTKIFYKTF